LTKHEPKVHRPRQADVQESSRLPLQEAGAPDFDPNQVITVSRGDLIEAVISELLNYFSDARVTGVKLQESEAVYIAAGAVRRVLRDQAYQLEEK